MPVIGARQRSTAPRRGPHSLEGFVWWVASVTGATATWNQKVICLDIRHAPRRRDPDTSPSGCACLRCPTTPSRTRPRCIGRRLAVDTAGTSGQEFPLPMTDRARVRAHQAIAIVLVSATVAMTVACGDASLSKEVSFPTADGGTVFADLYAASSPDAVVLAHGAAFDKASWVPFATWLAGRGHQVLAIDFRGHGRSMAGADSHALFEDVLAAVRYLHNLGVARVSVLGASMGGGAVAEATVHAAPWRDRSRDPGISRADPRPGESARPGALHLQPERADGRPDDRGVSARAGAEAARPPPGHGARAAHLRHRAG